MMDLSSDKEQEFWASQRYKPNSYQWVSLVDNQPVFAAPTINWNGNPYGGGGEAYLHSYMAKNLFQLQIPSVSCAAFESRIDVSSIQLQKPMPVKKFYTQLIPSEFTHENVALGEIVEGVYYTNDEGDFGGGRNNWCHSKRIKNFIKEG